MVIEAYNPDWPARYARIASVLSAGLGDLIEAVEHVGSTSVPGLAAKPVLDIDLVIQDDSRLPAVIEALAGLGYAYEGERGIPDRHAFRRISLQVPLGEACMAHHLYVCPRHSEGLADHLAFRDRLRREDAFRDAYAGVKHAILAEVGQDRDAYVLLKIERAAALYQAARTGAPLPVSEACPEA